MKEFLNRMRASRAYQRIRQISLPKDAKQHLINLLNQVKKTLQSILLWLCSKKHFWTVFSIGAAAAYLCRALPIIGGVLSALVLGLSALHGYAIQIRADHEQRFRNAYRYQEPEFYDSRMM